MSELHKQLQDKTSAIYNDLSLEEKEQIHNLFFNQDTKQELKKKLEQVIFFNTPPTPEEFLDPENGWLPKQFVDTLYPWVREEFLECTHFEKKYNKIVQYGSTRIGKTYLAILLITYIIVFIHHLREPAMYYGLSPLTDLAVYIISFKYDKTRELYLRPMFKMMEQSERFRQVKFQDKVRTEQKRLGRDCIVYSKAATSGEITLASGLQIQLGNDDALAFIGANLLAAFVSEISFWIENAGATEESIFRLYTDVSDRIKATVGRDYLTFLYLDTSANNVDSIIEKHILTELRYREGVRFNWKTRWDALPNNGKNFSKWHKTGETFKVITGNGAIPPAIVVDKSQLIGVPKDLVIDVPIDSYNEFKDNIIKSIKDIAGRPTQSENKFINEIYLIDNIFNNEYLKNVEGTLLADSSSMPEQLLWSQIKNKFFYQDHNKQYRLLRAPNEPRYLGIDLAFSIKGDIMGISMLHKEFSREKNQNMYVSDFCFGVVGDEKGINLDAPMYLVLDLIEQSGVNIYGVYSDTFQSPSQKQFAERNGVQFITQSVDRNVTEYQFFLTCLINEIYKSGRNIFLKNNLNCLQIGKKKNGREKVDHPIGQTNNKYNGDWEKSTSGLFAKDVSDAVCQSLWGAYQHNYIPSVCYEDENKRFSGNIEDNAFILKQAMEKIIISRPHL